MTDKPTYQELENKIKKLEKALLHAQKNIRPSNGDEIQTSQLEEHGHDNTLRTVTVPDQLAPLFHKAQKYATEYFSKKMEQPEKGIIEISGERYILVRAASMSAEFYDLIINMYRDRGEAEARNVALSFLFDIGHALGQADAIDFHRKMGVTDPVEKLSLGPVHFAHSGWAYVSILPESSPTPDDNFYLIYDHPFSFEADAWGKKGRTTDFPVCTMNAGYSSGWCEESFGIPLVAVEVECRTKGDKRCRFIMAPPGRIEERIAAYQHDSKKYPKKTSNITVPEFFIRKRLEDDLHKAHEELEKRVRQRTEELAKRNEQLQLEISERKKAHEETKRLEKQLRQAHKMEAVGTLAGGIAHEFNNLLGIIIGNSELALDDIKETNPARISLEEILTASFRAKDVVQQLLSFSRQTEKAAAVVQIAPIVKEALKLMRSSVPSTITIRQNIAADTGTVMADPTQIHQLLVNLCSNAIQSMDEAGNTLQIDLKDTALDEQTAPQFPPLLPGAYVKLSVSDTGPGIPPEILERIFDPYFTTREVGEGSGVGLSIVHGIVTDHGGSITVESTPGEGTVFHVLLPKVSREVENPRKSGDLAPKGTEKILLVDDETSLARLGQMILGRLGYEVETKTDPGEALEMFQKRGEEFDLVITDMAMPHMSGEALSARIKEIRPNIPIILCTGFNHNMDEAKARELGICAFITKPYVIEKLATTVSEVLGGKKQVS